MRILADLHISPRTVAHLRSIGHDVVRANELLPANAPDTQIIRVAAQAGRTILTQDLGFASIIALSGREQPSLITLRLISSRVEHVNTVLTNALPELEKMASAGAIITIEDERIRSRPLPLS